MFSIYQIGGWRGAFFFFLLRRLEIHDYSLRLPFRHFRVRKFSRSGNLRALRLGNDERRCEENVIAVDAVDAALRGVRQDVLVKGRLPDALGNVLLFGEWLARGFVLYEFDTDQKAESSDFADVGMRAKPC